MCGPKKYCPYFVLHFTLFEVDWECAWMGADIFWQCWIHQQEPVSHLWDSWMWKFQVPSCQLYDNWTHEVRTRPVICLFSEKHLFHSCFQWEELYQQHSSFTVEIGGIVRCWRDVVTQKYSNLPGIRLYHDFSAIKNPGAEAVMKVCELCYAGTLWDMPMRLTMGYTNEAIALPTVNYTAQRKVKELSETKLSHLKQMYSNYIQLDEWHELLPALSQFKLLFLCGKQVHMWFLVRVHMTVHSTNWEKESDTAIFCFKGAMPGPSIDNSASAVDLFAGCLQLKFGTCW